MTIILTFILLFNINKNPPGTIKVKGYYVDRTELQNIYWLEYLYWQAQELDSIEMQKLYPDSSNFWYRLPAHRYKPLVLITYEQALGYCAWRSKVVTEKIGKKVTYRLPSATEWSEIAEVIIKTDRKKIKKELAYSKQIFEEDSSQYRLVDVKEPKSRIYNLFDNVSEMTNEKGIAMGSNNIDRSDLEKNLSRLIKYDSPSSYLGFRCIAEIE